MLKLTKKYVHPPVCLIGELSFYNETIFKFFNFVCYSNVIKF